MLASKTGKQLFIANIFFFFFLIFTPRCQCSTRMKFTNQPSVLHGRQTVKSEQHVHTLQESVYHSGFVPLSVSHSLCLTHTRARNHPRTHARTHARPHHPPHTHTHTHTRARARTHPHPHPHTHARAHTHAYCSSNVVRCRGYVEPSASHWMSSPYTPDISEATTTVTINVVTSSFQEQAVSS